MSSPQVDDERSVGELVTRLLDDGRAYANAEIHLWQTVATERGKALGLPAALVVVALLVAQAGVTALCVALVLALLPLAGPLIAGLLTLLIAGVIAAGLGYFAYARLRSTWR